MRPTAAAAALAAAACLLLAGCAPTVTLEAAPAATSVGCAGVIVGMPSSIAGADRRNTDAQGTAAWGTPASVTLRCGVRTPDVSDLPCYPVDGVDWLFDERSVPGSRVLTTYGRDPGVQIVVNGTAVSVNDVLGLLSDPIDGATKATPRSCIDTPEGSAPTPGASAAPTPGASAAPTPTP